MTVLSPDGKLRAPEASYGWKTCEASSRSPGEPPTHRGADCSHDVLVVLGAPINSWLAKRLIELPSMERFSD
jgi:hypothetical protein